MNISEIICDSFPIADQSFATSCHEKLDRDGVLVLPDFIQPKAIERIKQEGASRIEEAYFCVNTHNVYLTPPDENFSIDHPRNREVISSKGLIGDDQVPESSPLKTLYRDNAFQSFIASVVGEEVLYPYADPLSAVNIHYAKTGQELGWHFDNSSFAITLLIDKPIGGGEFEYLKDVRDADAGEYNFETVGKLLDGEIDPDRISMEPGTLVLFRGRNSIHRVTPTEGEKTRMLAVLAYNSEPGIELSKSARMTFYGRLV
ncbi:MAG: 2OG-Fe(II) oxygenase [Rhizobiaceae bacterium]|nr:2OG-Fe(II) oxygenase [Rhizobiaceae bacterium]